MMNLPFFKLTQRSSDNINLVRISILVRDSCRSFFDQILGATFRGLSSYTTWTLSIFQLDLKIILRIWPIDVKDEHVNETR